jgi:hypothetical protein
MSKLANETYVRIDYVTKENVHDFVIVDESNVEDKLAELTEKGAVGEVKFTQTFGVHEVSDESPLDDLASLVGNQTEQANIINRSLRIKQMKHKTDLMSNDNFTPVEGVYDLADVAAAVSERKTASPEAKAARALSKLAGFEVTPEALAEILRAMNPASATA